MIMSKTTSIEQNKNYMTMSISKNMNMSYTTISKTRSMKERQISRSLNLKQDAKHYKLNSFIHNKHTQTNLEDVQLITSVDTCSSRVHELHWAPGDAVQKDSLEMSL